MKSNYHERKENRLAAFENLAAKNEDLSDALYNQSKEMASVIPMGQPILVGHHSEKADRNFRAKIDNKMGKSIEADKKAQYYRERAESLLNNTAISSDNPDAIELLSEKLERLTALQELYKAINKIVHKAGAEVDKVEKLQALGLSESTAIKMNTPVRGYGNGIQQYTLTNNNAVIKNTRDRIAHLENIAALKYEEMVINGVKLVLNPGENRLQIFFDGIPSKEVREQLKSGGFRWAPSVGAWMRQISNGAIWSAKNILNNLTQPTP